MNETTEYLDIPEFLRDQKNLAEEKAVALRSTADAIVDELFRNGFGDTATRLVLEVPGKTLGHGGGW
ncbi:MAG TPA: hypothetical protein VJ998_10125, partial [Pseudomonadales bacterium]|nr:hypothetical protein [Pseudomonadales bacterium]